MLALLTRSTRTGRVIRPAAQLRTAERPPFGATDMINLLGVRAETACTAEDIRGTSCGNETPITLMSDGA